MKILRFCGKYVLLRVILQNPFSPKAAGPEAPSFCGIWGPIWRYSVMKLPPKNNESHENQIFEQFLWPNPVKLRGKSFVWSVRSSSRPPNPPNTGLLLVNLGFWNFRFSDFRFSRFVFGKIFSEIMLVRYRGINNKGVLERPWTKWRVLEAISTTLKCQFTGKCRKVDFSMPCKTK